MKNKVLNIFCEFTKSNDEERRVWGYASSEALDVHGEIIEKKAIEKALPDYMEWANIREMHGSSAVGIAEDAQMDEKGLFITVKVVDDNAWKKVKEGVYKGFSIGGQVKKRLKNVIKELELFEISLVDRPANPEAKFVAYKATGLEEQIEQPQEEQVEQVEEKQEEAQADLEKSVEADAEEVKEEQVEVVEKSIYTLKYVLEQIAQLKYTVEDVRMESEYSDLESSYVDELKGLLDGLVNWAQKYAQREFDKVRESLEVEDSEDEVEKAAEIVEEVKDEVKNENEELLKTIKSLTERLAKLEEKVEPKIELKETVKKDVLANSDDFEEILDKKVTPKIAKVTDLIGAGLDKKEVLKMIIAKKAI